jgi:hypothetical protein
LRERDRKVGRKTDTLTGDIYSREKIVEKDRQAYRNI